MSKQIFVNLPVANFHASIAFFRALGFDFNPQFANETARCMIISDQIFVMLLTRERFQSFTKKPVSDARQSTEVLVCLSLESGAAVNEMVCKALAAGGKAPIDPMDHGFMYQHGFEDLDGHQWELVYMSPEAMKQ